MREILFRGFTPDESFDHVICVNGKEIRGYWVYGNYWEMRETTYCIKEDYDRHPDNTKYFIIFDQMTDWGLPNRHMQADVIPETVGQYTGLQDKNYKRIFEGDIVRFEKRGSSVTAIIRFGRHSRSGDAGKGTYIGFYCDFGDDSWLRKDIAYWVENTSAEVIGNIAENPELIFKE